MLDARYTWAPADACGYFVHPFPLPSFPRTPGQWTEARHWEGFAQKKHLPKPAFPSFVYYPNFEKKVQDLEKKGYLVPSHYREL